MNSRIVENRAVGAKAKFVAVCELDADELSLITTLLPAGHELELAFCNAEHELAVTEREARQGRRR